MKLLMKQLLDQMIIKSVLLKNYPEEGVIFLAPDRLFNDPSSRKLISQAVQSSLDPETFDAVAGIASRGLIFSEMIANQFSDKEEHFVQKVKVKGDPRFVQLDTKTEYSSDALQVLKGTIKAGKKYLLTDDLIATGGSVLTAIKLIRSCGGQVDTVLVMTELVDLEARKQLEKEGVKLVSLLQFTEYDLRKLLSLQECNELTAYIGSQSAIKAQATELACQNLLPLNIKLVSNEVPSGVNKQPMGEKETIQGAANRLNALKSNLSPNDNTLLISMENGLRYSEEDQCYFDFVHVIIQKGQDIFSHTQDLCKVPTDLVDEIPKDNKGIFLKTWGEMAKEKGLVKDDHNPHQEPIFGGVSRTEHLSKTLRKALEQLKKQMMPHSYPEIETEQVEMKRLLDLDSKKPRNAYAKRGVLFSASSDSSINSKPINLYNHGIPAKSWNIEDEKIKRNNFQVFSTGDAFSVITADIKIRGAHINIHVGTENAVFSPLTLILEGLQLCRCAYEQGARSITIALSDQFHPVLHYSNFNSLLIKLFKASGANRIYFYDKSYTGKLDANTMSSPMTLTISNQTDKVPYQIDRKDLLNYLHVSDSSQHPQNQLSLDYQVEHRTRQHHFNKTWSKFSLNQGDSFSYLGGSEFADLAIPEIKNQPHILLCCSANKPLAKEIAAKLRSQGEMVRLYDIQGTGAQAEIPKEVAICGAVVTIVQSTRPNPDNKEEAKEYKKNGASSYFFEAATIARQARLRGAETINLINPYQFNARSDKAEDNPKGKTGAYVQQNGMLLEAAGVNHVITAECHDNHTMSGAYTGKKIKGSAVSALSVISIKIAKQWIIDKDHSKQSQLRLVTPDAGATKRTKELTQQLEAILGDELCKTRILGEKQRDSHNDNSASIKSLNSGDVDINPYDKYLITDDETATGNTLCQAITKLKKDGAQDIAVIVVHNNMPLEWLERQLCLARFLHLGVTDLHFSDTQEMGSLAKSYDDLIQKQANIAGISKNEAGEEAFKWFKKNMASYLSDNTESGINQDFNKFQSLFGQFESKIKVHSLSSEFANQVATKPYIGNPYAFAYKVQEYIRKIQGSQAQSIVVFEGISVAAASAAALDLNLPLHVIPNITTTPANHKLSLPNQTFALIGTPSELTLRTLKKDTGYDGFEMQLNPSDPDGDLAIVSHQRSILAPNNPSQHENSNIDALIRAVERIIQESKQKDVPVKLLGIGLEGQLLTGQLSYLLNKKGIYVGIAAVDNKQTLTNPVVYSGHSGDEILSVDRNSLGMGDFCIAVARANDVKLTTKTILQKLATEAKVHCSQCCFLSNQGDCTVTTLESESASSHSISAATKSGVLFFHNQHRTTSQSSPIAQNATSAF